jgi:hypothetical protein
VLLEGERLTNLIIGTSDNSPVEQRPDLDNFDACTYFYGVMAAGERKEFRCLNRGRYLVIQMEQKNYLTMCEVEAYAGEGVVRGWMREQRDGSWREGVCVCE